MHEVQREGKRELGNQPRRHPHGFLLILLHEGSVPLKMPCPGEVDSFVVSLALACRLPGGNMARNNVPVVNPRARDPLQQT